MSAKRTKTGQLAGNIERLRLDRGWTQSALAKRAGVGQSRISDWERGRYPSVELSSILALAKAFNVSIDEVVAGVDVAYDGIARGRAADVSRTVEVSTDGRPEEFVAVPVLASRIAAGPPLTVDDHDVADYAAFSRALITKLGVGKPVCVRVGRYERSMLPTIRPGDTVLLDCSDAKRENPQRDRIYAVNVEEGSTLKRVIISGGTLTLVSDNLDKNEYPARTLECESDTELRSLIVGEAVWCGTLL